MYGNVVLKYKELKYIFVFILFTNKLKKLNEIIK